MTEGFPTSGRGSAVANMTRRQALGGLSCSVAAAALLPRDALAQQEMAPLPEPEIFSFDLLAERMRARAASAYIPAAQHEGLIAGLDYDAYRRIRFRPDHARWQFKGSFFRLHAFHPGWLFKTPVAVHEVVDGVVQPMGFSAEDFEYEGTLADRVPANMPLPTVAGFRLHAPLNRADIFDEVVAFLGASYFRALGRSNVYGISARGLAVNTAIGGPEEFPHFSEFWIERPARDATAVTLFAALDSPSVTGAFRFEIVPGETTVMDVTARLFLREDVAQLGIAPLTSMYLLGDNDRGAFDDFRPRVHDSEALVLNTRSGDTYIRPLNNPPRLASSYLGARNPASFGLIQRDRAFDSYLDAGAHYERRPSLIVEPLGDWGKGVVRLVEIPSDLEGNDNIVAFWVPEGKVRRGDALEVAYRLHWGMTPPGDGCGERARIVRTRVGKGGVAGVRNVHDRRKFVIDFEGGTLSGLPADAKLEPETHASGGEIVEAVLSRVSGTDIWRLVIEASAPDGRLVELRAGITGFGRNLSETWLYQWIKE